MARKDKSIYVSNLGLRRLGVCPFQIAGTHLVKSLNKYLQHLASSTISHVLGEGFFIICLLFEWWEICFHLLNIKTYQGETGSTLFYSPQRPGEKVDVQTVYSLWQVMI